MLVLLMLVLTWHKKIPTTDGDISEYLTGDYSKSIFLPANVPMEIINVEKMLKPSSSKGNYGISSKIIKEVISELSAPLSTICNISLQNGQFPDKLKIAKIIPIYKSDDRLSINNYRTTFFLQNSSAYNV
jgi:hypothetical protein